MVSNDCWTVKNCFSLLQSFLQVAITVLGSHFIPKMIVRDHATSNQSRIIDSVLLSQNSFYIYNFGFEFKSSTAKLL